MKNLTKKIISLLAAIPLAFVSWFLFIALYFQIWEKVFKCPFIKYADPSFIYPNKAICEAGDVLFITPILAFAVLLICWRIIYKKLVSNKK